MKQFSLLLLATLSFLSSYASSSVTYITSKDQFNSVVLQSKKPVVVKVFATWCGPCKSSTRPFEELSQEFPHATFAAVDIDKNGFIKQYATSLPTFLVFQNGKVVEKDEGFTSKGSWASIISRSVGTASVSQDDGKKKPELEQPVADQAAQTLSNQQKEPDTTVKGSACLAGQSYFANAYNAVRDFFSNIGNTIASWFK